MINKNHFIILFLGCMLVQSCRKEQSEPVSVVSMNTNPGIKISEELCGSIRFVRDTFYLHRYETNNNGYRTLQLICNSTDTNALSYEWFCPEGVFVDSIGQEVIILFNPDSVEEGSTRLFTVSLVTISQNNQRDSIAKIVYIKKLPVPWLGEFKGYNTDNPSDTFSVFFTRTDQYGTGPSCCTTYTVKNLPAGLNVYMKMPDIQTSFDFTLNNECEPEFYEEVSGYFMSAPKGYGKISGNNLVIDYYYMTPMPDSGSSSVIYKRFIGIKAF